VSHAEPALVTQIEPYERVLNGRLASSPARFSGAAVRDCPGLTVRDLIAVTERGVRAGCGLLVVERVMDRVPCAPGACCAS